MTNRWVILLGLMSARLVFGYQFQSVAAVGAGVSDAFQLSHAEFGFLVAIFLGPGVVLAIPGGVVTQKFGDKNTILFSLALMVAGAVVCSYAPDYFWLCVGRFLSGVGGALISVAATKMVVDYFAGKEIATATACMLAGFPVGIAGAFVGLGGANSAEDWLLSQYLGIGIGAICFLICLVVLKNHPDGVANGKSLWPSRRELGLTSLVGSCWSIVNISFITMMSFTPILLLAEGHDPVTIGFIIGLGPMIAVVMIPLGGVITDKFGRSGTVVAVGLLGWAACLLPVIWFADNLLIVTIAMLSAAILSAPPAGPIVSAVSVAVRPSVRALSMGIFYTIFYGGSLVAPPLIGGLADITRSNSVPIYAVSVLLLAAWLCFIFFNRIVKRQEVV